MTAGPAAVLYIEDNSSNVGLMDRLLGSRPAVTLLHAPDSHPGLKLAQERGPGVIFLDLLDRSPVRTEARRAATP